MRKNISYEQNVNQITKNRYGIDSFKLIRKLFLIEFSKYYPNFK
jgi:hypothetical protein